MNQNFLNSDDDDDDDFPLYFEFIRQISLPDFYDPDDEKSDKKINVSEISNKNQENHLNNDTEQNFSETQKEFLVQSSLQLKNNSLSEIQFFLAQNQEDLLIPESFFIVSDVYYSAFKRIRSEIILRLYRLPNFESNYIVHLKGRWCNLNVKENDPLLIISTFEKKIVQSSNFTHFNYETTIDNKNGFVVLWPYFMISATRLSDSIHCPRRSILTSMVPWDTTQPDWTLNEGTIAHSLVENVLTRKVENSNQVQQNISDLVNKNIIENGLQGMTLNQMTTSLQPVTNLASQLTVNLQNQEAAKKLEENISDLYKQQKEAQLKLEAEKQKMLLQNEKQKQMEIQLIIDQQEIEAQKIKQEIKQIENEMKKLEILKNKNISSPPYGCDVVAAESKLVSLQYGFVGICDLVLFDSKKQLYLPLEMKSGNSANGGIWQSHQAQLSTYILMMKEKYNEKATDYGKIFYMKDNVSIEIQQNLGECQSLEILRNSITYKSMNKIVPDKIENIKNCSSCQSLVVCEFMKDIEDIELGQYKPRIKKNKKIKQKQEIDKYGFSQEDLELQLLLLQENSFNNNNTSNEYDDYDDYDEFFEIDESKLRAIADLPEYKQSQINFYKKMHQEILNDIYENGYKQYYNWMKNVNEREKEGISINGLTLNYSKEMNSYFFNSEKIKNSKFKNHSRFVLTRNGKQPILSTGVVCNALHDSDILLVSLDNKENLNEGDSDLCIDLIKYITDSTPQIHNLIRLFAYSHSSFERISSMLVDNEKSEKFDKFQEDFFYEQLNEDQRKALKNSILSKDYAVISGCKSSGKTFLLSNLIQYYSTKHLCVLIIGPSESSVDLLCNLQTDIVSIIQIKSNGIFMSKNDESADLSQMGYIYATSINNYDDMLFERQTFDILIVDDCERIKMSDLIGPMNSCRKFVFCGDIYQARNDILSIFSFLDIEKNQINFLRTQYSKSREIHSLENSLIYNYSTNMFNNTETFKLSLNNLNDFHHIHQNWLKPVLSSSTYFIDVDINNDHIDECCAESAISAALMVSLLICGLKLDSIRILCYDVKCPSLIKNFLKIWLNSSSEFGDIESIEVHNYLNIRDNADRRNESGKLLIVCFGEIDILSSNDAMLSLFEAKERVYFVGKENILKNNPFFKKLLKNIDGNEKISNEILQSDEEPFKRISELI